MQYKFVRMFENGGTGLSTFENQTFAGKEPLHEQVN